MDPPVEVPNRFVAIRPNPKDGFPLSDTELLCYRYLVLLGADVAIFGPFTRLRSAVGLSNNRQMAVDHSIVSNSFFWWPDEFRIE